MSARQTAAVLTLLVAVVPLASPTPAAALRTLGTPTDPSDPTAPVLAVVGLLAWALACWLLVGALLVLTGRLPGLIGRVAGAAADRALPGTVRRALEVALGASLVVGAVGVSPATAGTVEQGDRLDVTRVVPLTAEVSMDWPVTRHGASAPAPGVDPTAAPAAAPAAPVDTVPVAPTGPSTLVPRASDQDPSSPPGPPSVRLAGTTGDPVVVQPGDSLWALATHELRAQGITPTTAAVAARWPVWWSANRAVIGADPDLLRPGTALTPPSS